MIGGVQFIATMQNLADDAAIGLPQPVDAASRLPHEDMSLEHVVPLDPFLGGAGLGTDLARFGSQANAICALLFSLLVILSVRAPRHRFEFVRVTNRQTPRLWLTKRSLLI